MYLLPAKDVNSARHAAGHHIFMYVHVYLCKEFETNKTCSRSGHYL